MIAFAKNNLRQPASLFFPKKDGAPAFNQKSFLFDGANEIIEGPPSSDIIGVSPTALTFSCWFKTISPTARYIQSVKRTNGTPSTLFSLRIPAANQLGFLMWNGATHITQDYSAPLATDGNWHHVCATSDDTDGVEIFYDGASIGSRSTLLNQTVDTVQAYTVGGFNNGWPSLYFLGNIDEPAVFTGATKFNLAEAVELYNGGVAADLSLHSRSADLKSWYRNGDDTLDDATGTTGRLVDQVSSPALDGTPFNTEAGDIVLDVP